MKHEYEILKYCDEWKSPTDIADVVLGRYSSSFASPFIKRLVEEGKLEKHPTTKGALSHKKIKGDTDAS